MVTPRVADVRVTGAPRFRVLAAAALTVGVTVLVGCTPVEQTPDPSPSTSPSAAPSPSASAVPAVAIPTDCRELVSTETYATLFEGTPLNDPGFLGETPAGAIEPTEPPAGATPEQILASAARLYCVWRDPNADITGLVAAIAEVEVAVAEEQLQILADRDYTCDEAFEGRRCQLVRQNDIYPVEEGHTVFLRDEVYITVDQFNFPTSGLLEEMVTRLWP